MTVHVVGGQWDERRNTSRVFPVAPDALPAALSALRGLRKTDPLLVAWLEEGHPRLTEATHMERFGTAYSRASRKKL